MADIQEKIRGKYGIDIVQENILKFYKIQSADISPSELEAKIKETHKRWETSINGANEKNAERDRARLTKADKYEAILKDDKLRKELYDFYNGGSGGKNPSESSGSEVTAFAREYFELVATTKKINKSDVDFFFSYYQSERKNKKAILEMLGKELKIYGLGKESSYKDDESDTSENDGEKKKSDNSSHIVNLFQETTIIKLRRAIEKYEEAAGSAVICQRYPKLQESLYDFLEISNINDANQLKELMSEKGKSAYIIRQEKGTEYVPLVDLFNILQNVADYKDVADNIQEFKLLIKYPNLTPYMFSFVEMKNKTVKEMTKIAGREYGFRDETDFILNYYQPVHDNFGISNGSIAALVRKAEKKANQNKVLNAIDEKLGRSNKRKAFPFAISIVHWLIYWPVFLNYFVFELVKTVFTNLKRYIVIMFVLLFVFFNWLFPELFGIRNVLKCFTIFNMTKWLDIINVDLGDNRAANAVEVATASFDYIASTLLLYVLPTLFICFFTVEFLKDFNKRFDWVGLERTFKQVLKNLELKTKQQYEAQRSRFLKNKIGKIILNFACLFVLIAVVVIVAII